MLFSHEMSMVRHTSSISLSYFPLPSLSSMRLDIGACNQANRQTDRQTDSSCLGTRKNGAAHPRWAAQVSCLGTLNNDAAGRRWAVQVHFRICFTSAWTEHPTGAITNGRLHRGKSATLVLARCQTSYALLEYGWLRSQVLVLAVHLSAYNSSLSGLEVWPYQYHPPWEHHSSSGLSERNAGAKLVVQIAQQQDIFVSFLLVVTCLVWFSST